MPKKFQGENSKAVVAKARRAEKASIEKAQKDKAIEDALWKEDDKLICKKIQRKEEKDRKRIEDLEKKKEKKLLEEMENIQMAPKTLPPQKVTVFQLQKNEQERKKLLEEEKQQADKSSNEAPLEENLNRLQVDTVSASGIDAAVAALSMADEPKVDKHPEKRMAAAFRAFEESRMPQLKKENPSMRLSQLKQLLRKEWQKSPQNPLVQKYAS